MPVTFHAHQMVHVDKFQGADSCKFCDLSDEWCPETTPAFCGQASARSGQEEQKLSFKVFLLPKMKIRLMEQTELQKVCLCVSTHTHTHKLDASTPHFQLSTAILLT
jgi:hypothetical protein